MSVTRPAPPVRLVERRAGRDNGKGEDATVARARARCHPARGRHDSRPRALADEQDRIVDMLRTLTPVLPGARLDLSGGSNRPPMEAALSVELLAVAQRVARALGLPEPEGGASDGNLTAGVGTPTLDGLGAVGGGAHAADEHVVIGEIPSRIALLAGLIRALTPNGSDHAH